MHYSMTCNLRLNATCTSYEYFKHLWLWDTLYKAFHRTVEWFRLEGTSGVLPCSVRPRRPLFSSYVTYLLPAARESRRDI